ncbi:MAG: hypothetical protein M3P96_16060 [Actinomycetota bacterium]|nr:hypothetical protein [Actinomycetota bacterium]
MIVLPSWSCRFDPGHPLIAPSAVVIIRDEVLPLLLEACPSFREQWATSERENEDQDTGGRLGVQRQGSAIELASALLAAADRATLPCESWRSSVTSQGAHLSGADR